MLRVAISSSFAVVRAGLEAVIRSEDGFEFAGVYTDDLACDVLLLDMPRFDEDQVPAAGAPPIVLLTADAAALRSGIRAILPPDATAAEIAAALTSAALGLFTLHPAAMDARAVPAILEEPLSPREVEVLALLAEGLSNKIIAYRLSISEHTVKFHIASIMAKLRATSRTDAAMQAIRRGLILI